jgi:hypothetical protein
MLTDRTTNNTDKYFDEVIEENVSIHGITLQNKREISSIFSSQLRSPSNRISKKINFLEVPKSD